MNLLAIKNNKIFSNASWIIGCKMCKAVLTFVVTMITARYLGVSNYGLISYAAGIVNFAIPIMRLGIDSILVREIVVKPEKEGETVGTAIILNIVSSVLCIIGVTAFAMIANRGEKDTILVCFCYSLLLLFQAVEIIYYWFHAKLLAKYSAIAMLFSYMLITVIQCVLIWQKVNVYWFALSHSIDFLFIAIFLLVIYKRKNGQKLSFSFTRAKSMLNISKYYILSTLMVTIYANNGRIMLKLISGNEETGIYSAAVTCAGMTSFVFAAIIDSMRPVIFESKERSIDAFNKKMIQLYSIIFYFSLFVCVGMTVFAPLIIKIMYGNAFIDTVSVLQIIVWYTTYSYFGTVRDIWILSENKQRYLWRINLMGAIANIILNVIFINLWGALGAAVSALITQIFTNVIVGYILAPIRPNNRLMIKGLNPKYFFEMLKH